MTASKEVIKKKKKRLKQNETKNEQWMGMCQEDLASLKELPMAKGGTIWATKEITQISDYEQMIER